MKRRDRSSVKNSAVPGKMPAGVIASDRGKLRSCSGSPEFPLWYEDREFICKDCGKREVWPASQQRWWYEVTGGDTEATAVRCRACRSGKRVKDAATTRSIQEARVTRAQKKAAELSAKLARQGPLAFAVLERSVDTLVLRQGVLETFSRNGVRTLGDLVSLDPHGFLAGLRPDDRQMLKRALQGIGLSLAGSPVARPKKP